MSDVTIENAELQEAFVKLRKEKLKKKVIFISVVAIALIALLGMVWLGGYNHSKSLNQNEIQELKAYIEKLEKTPLVAERVTTEVVYEMISKQVSEISELASAEYLFTNSAKFTSSDNNSWLPDWLTQKSFVQKWDGSIKAGVDLNKIVVNVSDDVITITMPRAEILSYEVDYDSVEIFDEQNNIFNPISVEDKAKFDAETAVAMKERAIENGLLDRAQKNAENIVKNLLTSDIDNIEEYKIEFLVAES